jgi:hypothetical protein
MSNEPYTRKEMALLGDNSWPIPGGVCPKCKQHIPKFSELSESEEQKLLKLIEQSQSVEAQKRLIAKVGCPPRWAKIWVLHQGKIPENYTQPCPYCGKSLRTKLAKQCPHCLMDWH